jgi:hypothetical protein
MKLRKTNRTAGTLLLGAAVVLASATTAAAGTAAKTTDEFTYTGSHAAGHIANPRIGKCYATKGTASAATNHTKLVADLYKDTGCTQPAGKLPPGQANTALTFASVEFTH